MEEDFEDRYADELEAMREMEMEFDASQRDQSRQGSKPTIASSKPQNSLVLNGSPLPREVSNDKVTSSTSQSSRPDPTDDAPSPAVSQLENGLPGDDEASQRKSRKRDIDEMFGPLSDSEDELIIDAPLPTIVSTAKRARKLIPDVSKTADNAATSEARSPTPEESALARVKQHRQDAALRETQQANITAPSLDHVRRNDVLGDRRLQILLREPPGLSSRLTGQDGQRVYLRMKEVVTVEHKMKQAKSVFKAGGRRSLRLLATSVEMLRDELENERHSKLIREAETISSSLKSKLDTPYDGDVEDEMEGDDDVTNEKSSALWVDEYAPRCYTDLLSDDGINRNLLFWLKLWDPLVFGKERKQRKKPQQGQQPQWKQKQQQQQQQQPDGKMVKQFQKKFQQEEPQEELDENNRPVHKISLLCGPPGLGKTTLAHVIAKHAGYNVVEMNASDDRSADVFRNKLESSTQMTSVLVSDRRPNCLIIDEIDGAPAPAINCLLTFIKGASPDTTSDAPASKKKKAKNLLRPIICICNDPYVPALRLLRQQAFVTHFPATLTTRLAARLNQISRNNRLRTDMTALMALCNKADNDIRSCLNTLQFIHSQRKVVSLTLIHSLSIGQKDKHKGFFAIWQDIFKLPQAKRKQYANPHDVAAGKAKLPSALEGNLGLDATNPTSMTARFYNVVQVAQAAGDYEKLMQGIFENYLEMKFKDPRLEALNVASDWLIFHDRLSSVVARSQNYTFYRYLPFAPVVFHLLFASSTQPRLKYPNTAYENSVKQTRSHNLLSTVLSEVSPNTACFLDPHKAVTEILPLLLIILQPTFRPVNTQLFNAQEKRHMKELINTMIAYSLTYNQERSMEGQYNYVLDPNLEYVVRFSNSPPTKQMTYAAKQLIAREISLEKMRRSEAAMGGKGKAQDKKPSSTTAKKDGPSSAGSKVPRHLEKLQPKKIHDEPEKPMRDFFGRIIKSPQQSKQAKAPESETGHQSTEQSPSQSSKAEARREQQEQLAGKVWYKFNQGFSNAVRKKVRIQDLL